LVFGVGRAEDASRAGKWEVLFYRQQGQLVEALAKEVGVALPVARLHKGGVLAVPFIRRLVAGRTIVAVL